MKDAPTPAPDDKEAHFVTVRKHAHRAICCELRDYPWMTLDPPIARKIHAMIPPDLARKAS